MLDSLSERERELRVNRTIHWLRQGVSPDRLDAVRIDVPPDELPALIEVAKARMVESEKAYSEMTRKGAFGYMAFGALMLCIAFYLAQGDIPLLRQGRLLIAFAIGGASFTWGLFRLFNQNPDYSL